MRKRRRTERGPNANLMGGQGGALQPCPPSLSPDPTMSTWIEIGRGRLGWDGGGRHAGSARSFSAMEFALAFHSCKGTHHHPLPLPTCTRCYLYSHISSHGSHFEHRVTRQYARSVQRDVSSPCYAYTTKPHIVFRMFVCTALFPPPLFSCSFTVSGWRKVPEIPPVPRGALPVKTRAGDGVDRSRQPVFPQRVRNHARKGPGD